ncbi:hypothetical protein RQM47_10375 [Rubrivirga sp. S365]|uniref:hypothetical protein n=1 Tax=Rubrivirga sp. S365 TaxID=3076080 RepID=UPI0028C60C70|nr:hypothetical protein [Rubrivirga sp. S365]MDT7857046.1 hypothetical protein [Rubrivirga sp. S365]
MDIAVVALDARGTALSDLLPLMPEVEVTLRVLRAGQVAIVSAPPAGSPGA